MPLCAISGSLKLGALLSDCLRVMPTFRAAAR